MSRSYTAPAIRRAAELLRYLADRPAPPTLSEIARELGYGKSTVHGILGSLGEVGWVEKDDAGGGFRVGEGLVALAREAFGARRVLEVARPLMERLAERVGESVFLGARKDGRVVIEDCVEGNAEMCVAARPGVSMPLLAGANGKVFLAAVAPEEARNLLEGGPLPRFTERTITDPEAFLAEVERAREQGYATDDEEYLRGVRAACVPLRYRGETVAALWVAGFSSSLTQQRLAEATRELLETAGICARLLEGVPPK